MSETLSDTLRNYRNALDRLGELDPPERSTDDHRLEELRSRALMALVARDRVADRLKTSQPSPGQWQQLHDDDRRLADDLASHVRVLNFKTWRETRQPSAEDWWWHLDRPSRLEETEWLWDGISLAALTGVVTIAVDTSSKLLVGGVSLLGSASIVVQSSLALLTARSVLSSAGKAGLTQFFKEIGKNTKFVPVSRAVLSVLLLVCSGGFYSCLPRFAEHFRETGTAQYKDEGQFASAVENYQRALAISPDDFVTRYYLGSVYEDLQQLDKAKPEYQLAATTDPDRDNPETFEIWLRSINNLARLWILEDKPDRATPLLLRGVYELDRFGQTTSEMLPPEGFDPEKFEKVRYALLKNLAWARLQQERYTDAERRLLDAFALDADAAPAYCILAQVRQAQEDDTASQAWEDCLSRAKATKLDEDRWIGMAKAFLSKE